MRLCLKEQEMTATAPLAHPVEVSDQPDPNKTNDSERGHFNYPRLKISSQLYININSIKIFKNIKILRKSLTH
jgi:hypothetical protein